MKYKGQLLLPGDDGPGLPVHLDLAEHHMAVEADGGTLGAWPLEAVDVARLEGDIFALRVAGESLRFIADDTIAFAYSGIPTIEGVPKRLRTRSAFRSFVDKLWNSPSPSGSGSEDRLEPPGVSDPVESGIPAPEPERLAPRTPDSLVETSTTAAEMPEDPQSPMERTAPAPTDSSPVDEVSSTRCPAVRSDGRRCESPILTTSGYCYPHDPKRSIDDKYRAAQEARAQIRKEATGRLNRIYGRLDKAMRQVERGELDPEIAMAMAQLARTMCAILDVDPTQHSEDSTERNA